eukprot:Colp12_sorted_trinity150504_noHs@35769
MVKTYVDLPTMVMIRPRGGDFLYSDVEFEIMKEDLLAAKQVLACCTTPLVAPPLPTASVPCPALPFLAASTAVPLYAQLLLHACCLPLALCPPLFNCEGIGAWSLQEAPLQTS